MQHVDPAGLAGSQPINTPPKANKPPPHTKYAFRAAIQASRELKGATKLVGLLLADFVNVVDGYAYPTVRDIMDKLGMPETTVHRALRNLQDRLNEDGEVIAPGWFRRETTKLKNGADGRNNWYPLYARAGLSEDDGGGCQNDRGGGCHERHPGVPSTAPLILTAYSPPFVIGNEPKDPSDSAAAAQQQVEGPAFPSGTDRPKAQRQPVESISLPDGCPFEPDDVAKRKDLTTDDVAAAEASFREKTSGEQRSPAEWKRTAKAWLKIQKPVKALENTSGTLLPEDFKVAHDMVQKAMALGLTHQEVQEAFRAFDERYRSISGTKALSRDWNASWMLWMRGAAERKRRSGGSTDKGRPTKVAV